MKTLLSLMVVVLSLTGVSLASGPFCPPCPWPPCPEGLITQCQGVALLAENSAMQFCFPTDPVSSTVAGISADVDSHSGASVASLGLEGVFAQSAQAWAGGANVCSGLITDQTNVVNRDSVATQQGLGFESTAGVFGVGSAGSSLVLCQDAFATNGPCLNIASFSVAASTDVQAAGGSGQAALDLTVQQTAITD